MNFNLFWPKRNHILKFEPVVCRLKRLVKLCNHSPHLCNNFCFSIRTMSSSTKRKHVYAEVLQSELRVPTESQEIVRVVAGRGNNLHDVESASGDTFLVTMPSKFRRNVWVKRGDYILVERIPEGDKVQKHIYWNPVLYFIKRNLLTVTFFIENHLTFV